MRVAFALLLFLPFTAIVTSVPAEAQQQRTYVFVHGAWGGGWDWRAVDSSLTQSGHRVERVTLTGLGERVHLASPSVGLDTHIADVVNTIRWENLHDVILVGHSYGGIVVTGAADRIPDRIRHVVYVDAFLPNSGESLLGLFDSASVASFSQTFHNGMSIPSWVRDTLATPRDVPHPVRTLSDTLRLTSQRRAPGTYILTVESDDKPDDFQRFADRAAQRGWPVHTLRGDHNPQRSARGPLLELLIAIP